MRRPKTAVLKHYPDAVCGRGVNMWFVMRPRQPMESWGVGQGLTAFAAWHDAADKLVAK